MPGFRPQSVLLGLLLAAGLVSSAAPPAGGQTLPFARYTSREGLASDRVKKVVADGTGFLWFCTASGLSRYDGHRFTTYGLPDGLPHFSVNDLLVAGDRYWVATNGGGVAAFTPANAEGPLFTPLPLDDPTPGSRRVNVLHRSADGRLWAGSDAGLFATRPPGPPSRGTAEAAAPALQRVTLADGESDRVLPVWGLAEDRWGRLYVATSHGLFLLDRAGARARRLTVTKAADVVVSAVAVDRRQRLWVGHEEGLAVVFLGPEAPVAPLAAAVAPCLSPGGRGELMPSLPQSPGEACVWRAGGSAEQATVRAFHQDGEGRQWVASDAGLVSFSDDRFASFRGVLPLPRQSLMTIGDDSSGNLWVGTNYHGAVRLVLDGFVNYGAAEGLGDPVVLSLFDGPEGELYVVTRKRLVHRLDGDRLVSVEPNLPAVGPDGRPVGDSFARRDRHGDWWFPTRRGLFRFPAVDRLEDLSSRRPLGPYGLGDGLAGDGARQVFPDSRGDLWVTTRFPGRTILSRWERSTETFHPYGEREGLPPYNPVISLLEHPEGTVWLGFWEGGLARYRRGRFDLFGAADGLPDGAVGALLADRDGRVWVGAHGGLVRTDDPERERPRFSPVAGAERLTQVSTLAEDLHGLLYLGTTGGLHRLDPRGEDLERFTVAEGLASDRVRVAYRDSLGDLWLGTAAGLSRLSPRPGRRLPIPSPRIEAFIVDGTPWPMSELGTEAAGPFSLSRRPARVRIAFGALSFHPGRVLRYRYRLEGADSDWSPACDERSVVFHHLRPGRYRLEVETVESDGRAAQRRATLDFLVPAPFWRRAWFLALVALALAFALVAAHRVRVQRILEVERERHRIAADLHDELGSGLTRISILSEVARRKTGHAASDLLEEVGESARSLLDSTRDLVWAIHPRGDDAGALAVRLRRFAADLFDGRGIRWRLHTEGALRNTTLTPEQRRHLLLFFKEALHNVVRHAEAQRVEILLAVQPGRVLAQVADDGRGVDRTLLEARTAAGRGRGLGNLSQRAASLAGLIEMDSAPGAGFRIRLDVPVD